MATSKIYYAQTDALGFPIPGVMMSAAKLPAQANIIEITKEMTLPQHPSGLKYYVRLDKNGNILPNSLFVNYNTLTGGNVVSLQQTPQAPAPTGIAVKVSGNQMTTPVCAVAETNLTIQITSGTSLSDALTITGDFASLGEYFTPVAPGDMMSQPPTFRVAYLDDDNLWKSRQFKLTAEGVASGADPMSGTTQESICPKYFLADAYSTDCNEPNGTDVSLQTITGADLIINKYYKKDGTVYLIKSVGPANYMSTTINPADGYFDTCAAAFV